MSLHPNLKNLINRPGESGKEVGRFLTNAMGHKEIVVMRKVHWDYLDWLVERGAMRLEAVIASIQAEQPSMEFGLALMTWLSEVCDDREQMGLPQPSWLPAPDDTSIN
ncbi:hypothetical protein [Jannaschia aquimarina]|nr:hypothetical protein [Jannaschia aquimarina]